MNGPPQLGGAEIGIIIAFYGFIFLCMLGIQAVICWFLYRACAGLPEAFRTHGPGMAFLLMIPLFGIVWIFIYTKGLSQGFQRFFSQTGTLTDDCGEKTGLWWGICSACSIIPCVGGLFGIASLVLLIIYLIKVSECRSKALAFGDGFAQNAYGNPNAFGNPNQPFPPSKNPYSF